MSNQEVPTPSGLPVLGHTVAFARDPFGFLDRATGEAGDAFRMDVVGTDVYVLTHPEHFRQVLVTDVDRFGKTEDFSRAFGSGLLSTEGDRWRRQRDQLQPFFYADRIRGYGDTMVEQIERRAERWSPGETLDVASEMKTLTLEVLFATLFGRKLDPTADADLYAAANGLNAWFAPSSWALPTWVPTPARRRFRNSSQRLREEVDRLVRARERADGAGDDLVSKLLAVRDAADGRGPTDETIKDQLVTFTFAGHETTALALTYTWYLLSEHPDVRDRLYAELDAVVDGREPTAADVERLDYADSVLREAMRLYPPVHTIPRRTEDAVDVDGYRIPADSEVHLSVRQVHRNGAFYDDPGAFRPERWTEASDRERHEFAYAPFGGGRRTCIGRAFALFEAKLVLATIGQRYRLDAPADFDLELDPQMTTQPDGAVPMAVTERD